jgi:DNA-binding transcriptional ArsR family regulator
MALVDASWTQPNVDVDRMGEHAREASEFLKALAHEARLMILCDLLRGEKSVGELEALLSRRQSTVSQQLALLSDCVGGQAVSGRHGCLSRRMALRMVRSLRAAAMTTSILGLPASMRRWRKALRTGL